MPDIANQLETLASLAHADGGWSYYAEKAPHLEPTCLALLALLPERERFKDVFAAGEQFLKKSLGGDGAFREPIGRKEAIWPTALALFVQAALNWPKDEIAKTASRLLSSRGVAPDVRDAEMASVQDIDPQLIGWTWAEGNFSWVEPTAWACVALTRAGYGSHRRVEEGRKLLIDRAFETGGINYGNRLVLGRMTDPVPGPTAIMLIAMQGHGESPRIGPALTYLWRQAKDCNDLEHLCWAKLALDCWRDRPEANAAALPELDQQITQAYESRADIPWTKPSPSREALFALATGTDRTNPFRQTAPIAEGSEVALAKQRGPGWIDNLKLWFSGVVVNATGGLRPLPQTTSVHIAKATDYDGDLLDVLTRQYEHYRAKVPFKGKRVVLKPNLVEYHREKVINTNPNVVSAVIELCKREGASEVIVAEGPGHWRNVEYLVNASGLGDVLRHHKVPFVDLNHDDPVKVRNMGRATDLEDLFLARTVMKAEVLISMPKLKTHHWAGATLSLKNLFGIMPGICYGWPKNELHWRGIDRCIVDIALTRTPDLAIVDGIIGMEGDGPLNGTAKPLGVLVMGTDLLAVDATCCRLMKLDPAKITYLKGGSMKRLGLLEEPQIQQIGERIDALAQPFETIESFRMLYTGR